MTSPTGIRASIRSVEAAAIAGVVYAVLALVALGLLNRTPSLELDNAELTAWFDTSNNRSGLLLALNLTAISSIAYLWFVAVIRRRLGDREDQFFATVFFGSAIAYAAAWLTAAATIAAPAVAVNFLGAATIDTSVVTLSQGQGAALLLVVIPRLQAVFVLASTTIVNRTGVLHRPIAVFGYVVGLALLITPVISRATGVAFPVWVLVVSVALLTRKPSSTDHQ